MKRRALGEDSTTGRGGKNKNNKEVQADRLMSRYHVRIHKDVTQKGESTIVVSSLFIDRHRQLQLIHDTTD